MRRASSAFVIGSDAMSASFCCVALQSWEILWLDTDRAFATRIVSRLPGAPGSYPGLPIPGWPPGIASRCDRNTLDGHSRPERAPVSWYPYRCHGCHSAPLRWIVRSRRLDSKGMHDMVPPAARSAVDQHSRVHGRLSFPRSGRHTRRRGRDGSGCVRVREVLHRRSTLDELRPLVRATWLEGRRRELLPGEPLLRGLSQAGPLPIGFACPVELG